MSITTEPVLPVSGTPALGFYVFQASLGSQLEFHPAQGTALLNEMIDIYVPGSASIVEKTGIVSIDFFRYSQATGLSSKFYSIPSGALCNNTPSLASTDSSSVSPLQTPWNCPLTPTRTAITKTPEPPVYSVSHSSKFPSASTSTTTPTTTLARARTTAADLSQIPGMKILTKDGVDVTNSASHGGKTREQRRHAHMMRIVGACDSCRRKKVRCDPKHRSSTHSTAISAITRSQATLPQSRKSLARKKAAAAAKAAQKETQALSQQSQNAPTVVSGTFKPSQHNVDEPVSFSDVQIDNFDDIMNWSESALPPGILQDYEIFDKSLVSPNFGSSVESSGVAFRRPSNPITLSELSADTVVKVAANNRPDSLPAIQKTSTAYNSSNVSLSTATEYTGFCLHSPSNSLSDGDQFGGLDIIHHKSSSHNGQHSHYTQQRDIGSAQETPIPDSFLTMAPTDIFYGASLSPANYLHESNSSNASDAEVYHCFGVDDEVTKTGSSSSVLVTDINSQYILSSFEAPPHMPAPELSVHCNPELCGYIGLASLFAIDCELDKDKQCNVTLPPAPPSSLSHPSNQPSEADTNNTSRNAQQSNGQSRRTLQYAQNNIGNKSFTTHTITRAKGRKALAAARAISTPDVTLRASVQSLQFSMSVQDSFAPATDRSVDYCPSYLLRFAPFTTLGSINIQPNAWINRPISPAMYRIYMVLGYPNGCNFGLVAKSSILDLDDTHKLSTVRRHKSHLVKTTYSWQKYFEKQPGELLSMVPRLFCIFYIVVAWATMIYTTVILYLAVVRVLRLYTHVGIPIVFSALCRAYSEPKELYPPSKLNEPANKLKQQHVTSYPSSASSLYKTSKSLTPQLAA